ncbi:MAG: cell division protein SepF [Lachnospiraceae bacterium]|nr:cell division protein SepF [Lachnospiraceae bacterium]
MGLFDKVKDVMFGEYVDEEEDMVEEQYEEKPSRFSRFRKERDEDDEEEDIVSRRISARKNQSAPVVSVHNTNNQLQVVIIRPEKYEDSQSICDQLKAKKPVVVNLEKVEYPVAQRIMDFLSGACYSIDGSIQRIANNIFIIAPDNVDVSGNVKEELKTKGVILPWVPSSK